LPWKPLTVGVVAVEGNPLVAGAVVGEAVGNRGNHPVARGGGIGAGGNPFPGAFDRCMLLEVDAVVVRTPCSEGVGEYPGVQRGDLPAGSWAACRGVACPGASTFPGAFQVDQDAYLVVLAVAFQVEKVELQVAFQVGDRVALAYLLQADLVAVALVVQAAVVQPLVALLAALTPLAGVLAVASPVEFGPSDRVVLVAIGAGLASPVARC